MIDIYIENALDVPRGSLLLALTLQLLGAKGHLEMDFDSDDRARYAITEEGKKLLENG